MPDRSDSLSRPIRPKTTPAEREESGGEDVARERSRSPCRRPLNGRRRDEVTGLGREVAICGIGVDVFHRGEKG